LKIALFLKTKNILWTYFTIKSASFEILNNSHTLLWFLLWAQALWLAINEISDGDILPYYTTVFFMLPVIILWLILSLLCFCTAVQT